MSSILLFASSSSSEVRATPSFSSIPWRSFLVLGLLVFSSFIFFFPSTQVYAQSSSSIDDELQQAWNTFYDLFSRLQELNRKGEDTSSLDLQLEQIREHLYSIELSNNEGANSTALHAQLTSVFAELDELSLHVQQLEETYQTRETWKIIGSLLGIMLFFPALFLGVRWLVKQYAHLSLTEFKSLKIDYTKFSTVSQEQLARLEKKYSALLTRSKHSRSSPRSRNRSAKQSSPSSLSSLLLLPSLRKQGFVLLLLLLMISAGFLILQFTTFKATPPHEFTTLTLVSYNESTSRFVLAGYPSEIQVNQSCDTLYFFLGNFQQTVQYYLVYLKVVPLDTYLAKAQPHQPLLGPEILLLNQWQRVVPAADEYIENAWNATRGEWLWGPVQLNFTISSAALSSLLQNNGISSFPAEGLSLVFTLEVWRYQVSSDAGGNFQVEPQFTGVSVHFQSLLLNNS